MNQYNVKITGKALEDMERIYNYIALVSWFLIRLWGSITALLTPLKAYRIHPSAVGSLIPSQSGIWVCGKG